MIPSSYEEYNSYTGSVSDNLDPRITPSESIAEPEILNPDADENLRSEDWSEETQLEYSTAQIDQTKPNSHEWHGWGTASISGQPKYGGAVRNVLLSGSYAELRKLRVDSDVDAEDLLASNNLHVGNNAYIDHGLGVEGGIYVGPDVAENLDDVADNYGIYVDDSKNNYIGNLETNLIDATSASFADLQVTDHTVLQGKTEISGDLDVGAPSFFQTTSVFEKDVHIKGNLYVQGTATYVNTDDLYVKDRSITIASGALNPEEADGAGFDIAGADVEFHYDAQTDHMTLNKSLEILGTGSIIAPSGSIDDLTSNQINVTNLTTSYAQFTTASGYFTGSFSGDGSGLTGVTMSVSDAPKCKHVINLTAGESMTITHPFKTQNVLVQVYKWADPSFQPDYQNGAEGIHAGGEDEVPASVWDEPAIQVTNATIKVRPVASSDPQDPYCVEISCPEDLHGYVVIADAGLYISGSGYVDIVEATREVHWFGSDGGLDIVPANASEAPDIEKGESYKFQHGLGTKNVIVQVYKYYPRIDEDTQEVIGWTPVQIYPEFIAVNDINEIEIKFSTDPEGDEDPELPQYFGYIVIAKAGSVVKSFEISEDDIEHFNIHWGDSGSWSARNYSIETASIESASIGSAFAQKLTVGEYIDTPKIGNLNTGDQHYHDYYDDQELWGSYMEFTDRGIASYVRNYGETDDYTPEGYNRDDALTIPTASLLDSSGSLHLRGDLYTGEVFNTSDIREKHNIETLENALDSIKKLRGVSFEWNKDGQKSIGTVAQEVQSIYPELTKVYRTLDGYERLAVNYEGLVGVLIEAVKSLAERVEQLEKNENR